MTKGGQDLSGNPLCFSRLPPSRVSHTPHQPIHTGWITSRHVSKHSGKIPGRGVEAWSRGTQVTELGYGSGFRGYTTLLLAFTSQKVSD